MAPTDSNRPAWNNARWWPVAYRDQHEASIADLPWTIRHTPPHPMRLQQIATGWQRFCFGALIGLLLVGPALTDWLASW